MLPILKSTDMEFSITQSLVQLAAEAAATEKEGGVGPENNEDEEMDEGGIGPRDLLRDWVGHTHTHAIPHSVINLPHSIHSYMEEGVCASGKVVEEGSGDWIKTSMENINHFLEAQKYSSVVSPPIHLREGAQNMIVENIVMSDAIKDIASGLKMEGLQMDKEGSRKREASASSSRLLAVGGGTRGDLFFSHEGGSRFNKEEQCKTKAECQKQPTEWCPSVNDYFSHTFSSESNVTCEVKEDNDGMESNEEEDRSSRKAETINGTSAKAQSDFFPPGLLGKFALNGVDPVRIADRKYHMKNETMIAYMNQRRIQQAKDYAIKEPNLVNKSREFLIEVTVYMDQATRSRPPNVKFCSKTPSYKIEVLGSMKLHELRDALMCNNDLIFLKELHHPDDPVDATEIAMHKLQSAMLLIDNTIYNDRRHPDNFDYAGQIIRWTSLPPNKNIGPFKRGDMSVTKLEDLTIQFGFPYLFRHLGDCEHVIVFNKARMLNVEDEHRLNRFPRTCWIPDIIPRLCEIHSKSIAIWAVVDCDMVPYNPMYICDECLRDFCYTKSGVKRFRFRLFPYRQLICEIPLPTESFSINVTKKR